MIDGSFTESEKALLPPSPCAIPVLDQDDSFDSLWNDIEDISCISGKGCFQYFFFKNQRLA